MTDTGQLDEDEVCEVCHRLLRDHDFGEALSHILRVPIDEGRKLQRRIVDRLDEALEDEP